MHNPTDRITHTMTVVIPVMEHWLEREIAQWVHPEKDRSDDPSHHERTLLPRRYISLRNSNEVMTVTDQTVCVSDQHCTIDKTDCVSDQHCTIDKTVCC